MNEFYYLGAGILLGGVATLGSFLGYSTYKLDRMEKESMLESYTRSYEKGILNVKPTLKNVREIEASFSEGYPKNQRFLIKENNLAVVVQSS
jgi:uncharacterized protein YbgA (DUF1722 family)